MNFHTGDHNIDHEILLCVQNIIDLFNINKEIYYGCADKNLIFFTENGVKWRMKFFMAKVNV